MQKFGAKRDRDERVRPLQRRIRLLVCDDHKILTDLLAMLVARDPQICMAADPVHTGEDAVSLCEQHRPDVVLMDIQLNGGISGIEATRQISRISPHTKVVIISGSHDGDSVLLEVAEAGAVGFLDKARAVEDLVGAVRAAAAGEMLIRPEVLWTLLRDSARAREARKEVERALGALTRREREILGLLAQGLRTGEIAARLHLSLHTVNTHIQNLLARLGVHSQLEAVAFAAKHGAVRTEDGGQISLA